MSCIPKLLEMKGDEEALRINSRAYLLDGGVYKGFDYCVTINNLGFRCAYVAIPENHPLYSKKYQELDLEVHGDLTFSGAPSEIINDDVMKITCNDHWIGFDAGHSGDATDYETAFKYFDEETGQALIEVKRIREEVKAKFYPFDLEREDTIKTTEYMINECKELIDQIV